jgi:hypothetical protein
VRLANEDAFGTLSLMLIHELYLGNATDRKLDWG